MRVLIVKLSSLGDVVHALPVVHDLHAARPGLQIDWVVEPAFAPLLQRTAGLHEVLPCALRRWRKAWWTAEVRQAWRAFRTRLQAVRYDAVIDLQGLTKSAVLARLAHGPSWGLANQTDGSSFEAPARWLVDHPVTVPRHVHALDRSRLLAGAVVGVSPLGPPTFGLAARLSTGAGLPGDLPLMVLVHGTSRDDKLWPEAHWIELGRRLVHSGWQVALPHAGAVEQARAARLAEAIGGAAQVWPAMALDALVDRMGTASGVVGVDSGLSHIAVALGLPHVQVYNTGTAWRTGPQEAHGHRHQVSVEPGPSEPTPSPDAVWAAWRTVADAPR